jgi:hypothetical protein
MEVVVYRVWLGWDWPVFLISKIGTHWVWYNRNFMQRNDYYTTNNCRYFIPESTNTVISFTTQMSKDFVPPRASSHHRLC